MQLEMFKAESQPPTDGGLIGLDELIAAYYSCRKTKHNTINALAFEVDCESKLYDLWRQINEGSYQPGRLSSTNWAFDIMGDTLTIG